ncbi:MAG TPA: flagellar basal body-associated FliL family protein [Xanthobacteraceae bacterium]|nr:flagellar basal body-associated FliL family protein [Xanthobacteraceae bacterium]
MATNDEDAADVAADGGQDKPAKKGMPIRLIVIALGVILLGGGAWGASKLFLGGQKEAEQAAIPQPKPPVFLEVPDVLVNLASTGGERSQYLKVKVVLELPDEALAPQIQLAMPRVLDTFQTYLREMRPSDLDGSAGLYRLKEELTHRVNASIAPRRITAVLFKEMIVQ